MNFNKTGLPSSNTSYKIGHICETLAGDLRTITQLPRYLCINNPFEQQSRGNWGTEELRLAPRSGPNFSDAQQNTRRTHALAEVRFLFPYNNSVIRCSIRGALGF